MTTDQAFRNLLKDGSEIDEVYHREDSVICHNIKLEKLYYEVTVSVFPVVGESYKKKFSTIDALTVFYTLEMCKDPAGVAMLDITKGTNIREVNPTLLANYINKFNRSSVIDECQQALREEAHRRRFESARGEHYTKKSASFLETLKKGVKA